MHPIGTPHYSKNFFIFFHSAGQGLRARHRAHLTETHTEQDSEQSAKARAHRDRDEATKSKAKRSENFSRRFFRGNPSHFKKALNPTRKNPLLFRTHIDPLTRYI